MKGIEYNGSEMYCYRYEKDKERLKLKILIEKLEKSLKCPLKLISWVEVQGMPLHTKRELFQTYFSEEGIFFFFKEGMRQVASDMLVLAKIELESLDW